jgi:Zinc-finger associated domain (zf-AD)
MAYRIFAVNCTNTVSLFPFWNLKNCRQQFSHKISMKSDVKYEKACRCCLAEHGHMKNLIEDTFQVTNGESITLLEGFTKCSGINPEADKTHTNVCNSCENKLIISYEFREQCQTSNRILEEHLPVVKLEHYSDEEAPPRKKEKTTKKKKPGRPKKVADVPEIVYMKEEPFEEPRIELAQCEEPKTLDDEKVKEESIIIDSNSIKANDSDNEDDIDGIGSDDRDFNDDDDYDEEEEDKTEADSEKKDPASYQCFHCDIRFRTYTLLCRHKNAEHPVEQRPIKRTCPVCHTKT